NRYTALNFWPFLASVLGLVFIVLTVEKYGVYAAAFQQLAIKLLVFIILSFLFFPLIFKTIKFEKEQFFKIFHGAKYITLGSIYYRSDELVERYITSYLTGGFVSLVAFVQRVYGAVIVVLNAAI